MRQTAENALRINGTTWPIPERFTFREQLLLGWVSRIGNRDKFVAALEAGEPDACAAFVLVVMRRDDPTASVADAQRAIGVS